MSKPTSTSEPLHYILEAVGNELASERGFVPGKSTKEYYKIKRPSRPALTVDFEGLESF